MNKNANREQRTENREIIAVLYIMATIMVYMMAMMDLFLVHMDYVKQLQHPLVEQPVYWWNMKNDNKKQETRNKKQEIIMTCFLLVKGTVFEKETKIASTIMARDYKGFGNYRGNAVIVLVP